MKNVWMLSPFTTDSDGTPYPTCNAYASGWQYPWLPAPAGTVVPVAHVQSANNSSLAGTLLPLTATFSAATTAGNLIIVTVMQDGNTMTPGYSTVNDSAGNPYQSTVISNYLSDVEDGGGSVKLDIFWTISTVSASSVTVTSAGGSQKNYWVGVHEYSGVGALDYTNATVAGQNGAIAFGTANQQTPITVTIPATIPGELIFALYGGSGNDWELASAGYSQRGQLSSINTLWGAQYSVMEQDLISPVGTTSVYNAGGRVQAGNGYLNCYVLTFTPNKVPTGLGLVYVQATDLQIAAAQADPTITVLTNLNTPIPALVANSYYLQNATTAMSLGSLLLMLGAIDPNFMIDPNLTSYVAQTGQVNSDWNAFNGPAAILNKPTLPSTFVSSVAGKTGAVILAESDIPGLTTDLAATEKSANKGVASGYAALDATGKVPSSQLPSASTGGMPTVVASLRLASQTTAVSGTLYTPTVAGIYRVSINIRVYSTTGGSIFASWGGTDSHGALTLIGNNTGTGVNANILASTTTVSTSYLSASAPTSYVTTFNSIYSAVGYDVFWVVERLV